MKRKRTSAESTAKKSVSASQSQVETPTRKERKQLNPKKKYVYTNMLILGKKSRVRNTVIKDIKALQRSTHLLIPKSPFARLIREICMEYGGDLRIQAIALEALQEAAEAYLIDFFEDSYICALHAKRVTLLVRDTLLAKQLRKEV